MKNGISNQRGVTVTELMTVLAILTVLATIGAGAFVSSLPRYRLNAAALELVSDMRLARSIAATENWQYAIRFTSTSSYEVIRGDQPQLPSSGYLIPVTIRSNEDSSTGWRDIRWYMPVWMPVFQPDGRITSWNPGHGSFQIILPDPVVLSNPSGETKTVTLSRFGRIQIE